MEIKSRVWERHTVGQPTMCVIQAGDGERLTAEIRDVSMAGIGLLLERRHEPGTILDFAVPETAFDLPAFMSARVVHASALPGGQWLHGCVLVQPLTDDELKRFLGQGKPELDAAPALPPVAAPIPPPAVPVPPAVAAPVRVPPPVAVTLPGSAPPRVAASLPAPVPPPVATPQPAPSAKPVPPPAPALNAYVVDQVFASWFGRAQRNG